MAPIEPAEIVAQYKHFFEPSQTADKLIVELEMFGNEFGFELDIPSALKNSKHYYPMINKLMGIEMCLNASSATGERSFSALSNIMSKKRSTMGQGRLTGLLLICCNRALIPAEDAIFLECKKAFPKISIFIQWTFYFAIKTITN